MGTFTEDFWEIDIGKEKTPLGRVKQVLQQELAILEKRLVAEIEALREEIEILKHNRDTQKICHGWSDNYVVDFIKKFIKNEQHE